MNLGDERLSQLVSALGQSRALRAKQDIQPVARLLSRCAGDIRNGDDAAVLPDRDGYTLIAAEGMLPSFVQAEPWFAGFCAVMTNVSDIAAMGGRPRALVDVFFATHDDVHTADVLEGLAAGAEKFAVPLVGGHTARSAEAPYLSAAIVGRAKRLITSFDARPGDVVIACIDLRGEFRGDSLNFDAVSCADAQQVRAQLELLPELAEAELVHAGKDISMAGLVGTLLMLIETSGCAATLDLAAVPAPASALTQPLRWLSAFPSFGYLLVAAPAHVAEVIARAQAYGVHAATVAQLHAGTTLDVTYGADTARYWDLARQPLLGFGATQPTQKVTQHA
jgi:AIR synthase-related protein